MRRFDGRREPHKRNLNKRADSQRVQRLDMGREKYFRFDLSDLLDELKVGENKNTIAATILNKMTSHSFSEAVEYVDRLTEEKTFDEDGSRKIRNLLQRYSRWR